LDPNAEFAVEIDPRDLGDDKIRALSDIGVNRVSIGVQDVHPEVQRAIIVENLLRAQGRNNCTDCAKLGRLLAGYLDAHPDCRECEIDRARPMAEVIAIGLVERALARAEEIPQDARAVLGGIDDAKRRRDCAACGAYCLRLLGSLER
jgi:hypothetical protein